jgi:hypothetical protein
MTTTIKAYYNGTSFVPIDHQELPTGKVFLLSVLQEDETSPVSVSKKVKIFQQITDYLHTLNDTEPLPHEFDEILSHRIHFKTETNL